MKIVPPKDIDTIISFINNNELVILPTDTVMGISARVSRENLERINNIKIRPSNQPILALVANVSQITQSGWSNDRQIDLIEKLSKLGPITMIVDSANSNDETGQAVRLIKSDHYLHQVICETGPIYSTSANKSGQPVINTCDQAVEHFGNLISIWVEPLEINSNSEPSTLIDIRNDQFKIIREGRVKQSDIQSFVKQIHIDS